MATKPKPKNWASMSKAKQDAWRKANFNSSTKVTTAQLNKLRAEKTPAQAIAKYKNDPAMREALNRFYGKSRVGTAAGSGTGTGKSTGSENSGPGSSSSTRGGPGAKPRQPRSSTTTPKNKSVGDSFYGSKLKKLTTPSDFSVAGAYRAATGKKPKYGSEAKQQAALAVVSMIPAVRGVRAAGAARKAITTGKATVKTGPKAIGAPKKPLAIGPGPKVAPKPKVTPKPKVAPVKGKTPKVAPKPKAAPKKTTPKK